MPDHKIPSRKGRAASYNPPNRFQQLNVTEDPAELDQDELRQVRTQFFVDTTRSALASNNSPDIPFTYSLNPYRGCEHGCIYCYARPSHEYLGFSSGLDFETKIVVKSDIERLLSETFERKSWQPQVVSLSGNTDPYQPVERKLHLTRSCLKVFAMYRNPVSIITKNHLITRDLDILQEMAVLNLVHVMLSITSLKPELIGLMEPRTSRPERRLKAIRELADAGVPVGVMVAPLIPGLTDEELPDILEAAADHGATEAYYIMLKLPGAVKPLFLDWLERNLPDRKSKVVNRLRDIRGDELTDNRYGIRMRGEGPWAEVLSRLHRIKCRQLGLNKSRPPLATHHFRRILKGQLDLFS